MLAEAARAAGAPPPVEAAVRFPLPPGREEDALVELVAQALPANARLAVFDAVTSNTALKLPIKVCVLLLPRFPSSSSLPPRSTRCSVVQSCCPHAVLLNTEISEGCSRRRRHHVVFSHFASDSAAAR